MIATLIVGIVFFGIVGVGAYKSFKAMRNNKCPGCSGGCSEQSSCHVTQLK